MIAATYPGAIFLDPNFVFLDGTTGKKLFVVLSNGVCGYYIVARTTSKDKFRSRFQGCNLDDRNANYFIPDQLRVFDCDTWICMDYLVDFDKAELERRLANNVLNYINRIDGDLLLDVVRCAAYSDDVSIEQEQELCKLL